MSVGRSPTIGISTHEHLHVRYREHFKSVLENYKSKKELAKVMHSFNPST